jgi:Hint domain
MIRKPVDSKAAAQPSRRKLLKTGAILGSIGFSGMAWGGPPPPPPPAPRPPGPTPGPGNGPPGPKCFLKGARILTVAGEVSVEDLEIGDLLPTMFGGPSPIQWIGRYAFKRSTPSKAWPKDSRPVRIARSALAPNVPRKDLYVTQAHALLVDGVLISAGFLINDSTITLDEVSDRDILEFFHIKLESHDVIYAEGAPVETLLNVDEGAVNFAEYLRMHGGPVEEDVPCLPILSIYRQGSSLKARYRSAASWIDRRRQIRAIRDRLAERATMLARQSEFSA